MRLLVWLSALLLGAAGCGISDTDHPAGESKIFEYTRSGGLAYSVYEVEIAADGSGVARFGTDPGELVEKSFKLAPTQLESLRSLLEENPPSSLPDPGDAECADCFEYVYEYGGNTYVTSNVAEPVAELQELDALLAELPLPRDRSNGG